MGFYIITVLVIIVLKIRKLNENTLFLFSTLTLKSTLKILLHRSTYFSTSLKKLKNSVPKSFQIHKSIGGFDSLLPF